MPLPSSATPTVQPTKDRAAGSTSTPHLVGDALTEPTTLDGLPHHDDPPTLGTWNNAMSQNIRAATSGLPSRSLTPDDVASHVAPSWTKNKSSPDGLVSRCNIVGGAPGTNSSFDVKCHPFDPGRSSHDTNAGDDEWKHDLSHEGVQHQRASIVDHQDDHQVDHQVVSSISTTLKDDSHDLDRSKNLLVPNSVDEDTLIHDIRHEGVKHASIVCHHDQVAARLKYSTCSEHDDTLIHDIRHEGVKHASIVCHDIRHEGVKSWKYSACGERTALKDEQGTIALSRQATTALTYHDQPSSMLDQCWRR